MARMCEIAFGQLSMMLGDKPRKAKVFVQPKSKFGYMHLTLCVINIAEDGDKLVPISSGYLLLEEGEMGSDRCLLSSS